MPDEATLHRMMVEMPFTPFTNVDVRAFVDGETGWRQAREAIGAMMQA